MRDCDYVGECDRCHRQAAVMIDHSEPGEYAYCGQCSRIVRDAMHDRHDLAVRHLYRIMEQR